MFEDFKRVIYNDLFDLFLSPEHSLEIWNDVMARYIVYVLTPMSSVKLRKTFEKLVVS